MNKKSNIELDRKIFPYVLRGELDEICSLNNQTCAKVSNCHKGYNSFEEYIISNYKTFNDLQLGYLFSSTDGKMFLQANPKVLESIKNDTMEFCEKYNAKKSLSIQNCLACPKEAVCKGVFAEIVK